MKKILLSICILLVPVMSVSAGCDGGCEGGGGVSIGPGGYSMGVSPFYPSVDLMEFYKIDILKFLLESYRNFHH